MRAKLVLTPELVAHVDRKVEQDHLPDDPNRVKMTDDDFAQAVAGVMDSHPERPIWIFGYGSLLWNPGFHFVERRQAHMLARAAGYGGSGAAYLQQTVAKLDEQGIHDTYLWELQRLVAAEIRKLHP